MRWDSGKIDGLGCVGSGEPSRASEWGRDVSGVSQRKKTANPLEKGGSGGGMSSKCRMNLEFGAAFNRIIYPRP